jgi:hypothetical protein
VTAGKQSVTAADRANGKIMGKQGGITVSPAAVSNFTVVSSPSSVTAGSALQFTVTALDAYGNTVTGYRGTVKLTSSDPQAVLPANYTFGASDKGVHVFSVTLKTAGSQTITVADTANSSVTGTSGPVTVSPAAAAHFTISAQASVTHGTSFSFTVTARDAYGNVATGYTGTVSFSLALSDPKATINGVSLQTFTYTFTSGTGMDNGVHTFSAILNTVGSEVLTVTDKKNSITGTANITVA